ncbi:hypothetical protein ACH5RR_000737 [Cinchona calisaya]|uniref:Uncharacterized protein n=1 Tax=Cinchona calisaya TaxID=153742 RepID=A0ABD3B1R9_9GENT
MIKFASEGDRKENDEVQEGRKSKEQLIQQVDLYNIEKLKTQRAFEELEKEKQQLLAKLGVLENKVYMIQTNLQERSQESYEEIELHGKLLKKIEAKDSQLTPEKQKRRDVVCWL